MTQWAISIENLQKEYIVGGADQQYQSLRDLLTNVYKAPLRRLRRLQGKVADEQRFLALQDINLQINQGEVVGLIGNNGAGKSTLLKVLSRITAPSAGRVKVRGRLASLLEVGTGFHPELTGRENIYLNGAVMGMSRRDVQKRFDAIVDFAELGRFVDTPIKRYSSGMFVRLAFSVAAHLEPDILLIDEVLAVGDADFQKKCLGTMGEVAAGGRTVVFVSHNMASIATLCPRVVCIGKGRVVNDGPANEVIADYLHGASDETVVTSRDLTDVDRAKASNVFRITHGDLSGKQGQSSGSFAVWEPLTVKISAVALHELKVHASFWILIRNREGHVVLSTFQYDEDKLVSCSRQGAWAQVTLDPNPLLPGQYSVSVGAFDEGKQFLDWVDDALRFEIRTEFESGKTYDERLGMTSIKYRWDSGESA